MEVQFYMKRLGVDSDYIDIEERFKGMRYMKCDGLEDLGKPKNIYTETYADAAKLRVFQPNEIKRTATTITFSFAFFGDSDTRQRLFDDFNTFIENQRLSYYDTARNKKVIEMILLGASKPKNDVYLGQGYITADYTFQNLYGECERM
jgi:hypothetical protein